MTADKPLLGMVHLLALPSAAAGECDFERLLAGALRDAETLAAGGVDGVIVENYGDAPYCRGSVEDPVPPDVAAGLAVVAREVRSRTSLPVGINCLRNDGYAALGAAAVAGARWIRVNVLSGAYVGDQGILQGEAARLRAYSQRLGSEIGILADFMVKHAVPLGPLDPQVAARDLAERSGAAALVLSGNRTGEPVDPTFLSDIQTAVGDFPVWIGSGLTADNAARLWPLCDGAIVGTSLKVGGRVDQPVEARRVAELRRAVDAAGRGR